MKLIINALLALTGFQLFLLTSCFTGTKDPVINNPGQPGPIVVSPSAGTAAWHSDSTGGSHQDTLTVYYPPRKVDCLYAPITILMIGDSTGGSHRDTTIVSKVMLRQRR